jgi:hypothetical protein
MNIQGESFRLKDKRKAGVIPEKLKKEEKENDTLEILKNE